MILLTARKSSKELMKNICNNLMSSVFTGINADFIYKNA